MGAEAKTYAESLLSVETIGAGQLSHWQVKQFNTNGDKQMTMKNNIITGLLLCVVSGVLDVTSMIWQGLN